MSFAPKLPDITLYDVKIKGKNTKFEAKKLNRENAMLVCHNIVEMEKSVFGPDYDKWLEKTWDEIKASFGFMSKSDGKLEFSVSCYLETKTIEGEKHTCGSRASQGKAKEGVDEDTWQLRGNDKCCSYCGSSSWEKFLEVVDKVIAGEEGYSIEASDKKYKFYIQQPEVPNASFGAIKFYTWHAPEGMNEQQLKEVNEKIHQALVKSNEIFMKRFKQE